VAQVIVNSAKVEVDFMKVVHGNGSGFIPLDNRGEYQQPKMISDESL
jgi:hypothetical protein